MDLFKKKKIRRLLDELEDRNNDLIKEKVVTKKLNERIDNLEKITNTTMEENQKLIKWIENILKEFGTVEARENHVSIPIYKRQGRPVFYTEDDIDKTFSCERQYIEIPSITIVKMG